MRQPNTLTGLAKLVQRSKWFIVLGWIVVLVLSAPFMNKLTNSVTNTNALPDSSQAQKVATLLEKADPTAVQEDMEVVYESTTRLSPQNLQTIADQRSHIVAAKLATVASVSTIVVSPDNQSAYFTLYADIPNNHTGPTSEKNIVKQVRATAKSSGKLSVSTTGAMAVNVDSNSANVDKVLLLSAAVIVAVLLVATYRSPILWIVPLISAIIAISLADAITYAFVRHGLQANSSDTSILIVLVFGVATDYAMLLVSRYRENLHTHANKNEAMALAAKGSLEAISASAATVVLALLALIFASFSATKNLGPVAAIGVACAFLVQMTFLPAVLAIGGRFLLWPRAPKFTADNKAAAHNGSRLWHAIAQLIARYPRRIAGATTVVLLVGALGLLQLRIVSNPTDLLLRGNPPAVQGQKTISRHFSAASNAPLIIVGDNIANVNKAKDIAKNDAVTGSIGPVEDIAGHPSISVVPKAAPYSATTFSYIARLRSQYAHAGLHDVNVGGVQAQQYDYKQVTARDDRVLIPIILVIVSIILGLLLRSVIAPLALLATVVLSFAASFGISMVIFRQLFHFAGLDPAIPIYTFLFVVALGIDYNIFLMDRARQEASTKGTREGVLHALRVTGGVITAAGLVLAGTFTTLGQVPFVALTELGVSVAIGVLIDSFLVRSFLVPSLTLVVGKKIWWPGRLAHEEVASTQE